MTDEDWETLAGCIGDSSAAAIRGLVENKWIQRQILEDPDGSWTVSEEIQPGAGIHVLSAQDLTLGQILHIPDRDLAWRAWQELIEAVQFSEDQGLIFRPWSNKQ